MDLFGLSQIQDLSNIIGLASPHGMYGSDHPKDQPRNMETVLSHLIVDPLKFIIEDRTGQVIVSSDIVKDKTKRTIQINFGGDFVLIDYKTQVSISFSNAISAGLQDFINNYFAVIKKPVNNVLSYWSVQAQLSKYQDSFKKAFYSEIFPIMSKYIPIFEDIPIDKISLLLYPNKRPNYLQRSLTYEKAYTTTFMFTIDELKFNVLHMKGNDLNSLLERELTKTEFRFMQAEILEKINEFVLTYTIESGPNTKVFKYAYYSNVPNRDRAIIHNFISSIIMVAKLCGQREIGLIKSLKNIYHVGEAIKHLRRRGFPTIRQKSLVKDLKTVYDKIYNLFERDFGTRDPAMINYGKLSRDASNRYYAYSEALRSIEELCKHEGYNFALSSIQGINLLEAIENKKELVMNSYDLNYWDRGKLGETVKTFHRFYYLTKLLGFDPLFFVPLDEDLGTSQRHHFLAVLFRKMSSYVRDHVLTTEKLHRTYDALFADLGRRQTQALIEGAIAAMEELIWLRDGNGDRKELTKADIPLIKSILKKHLGSLSGKVWEFWTKGRGKNTRTTSEFLDALNEFNGRRKYIMASDGKLIQKGYQDFLDAKFHAFYDDDFQKVTLLDPELFLGSKKDFIFMNFVYMGIHRFDLSKL